MTRLPNLSAFCLHGAVCAIGLLITSYAIALPSASELGEFGANTAAMGTAVSQDNNASDYIETYLDDPLSSEIRAVYWSLDREPIAYKKLEFSDSNTVPNRYEIIDYRRKKGYRVTVNNSKAVIDTLKQSADGSLTATSQKSIQLPEDTVIDAGFHRVVLANWNRLSEGKTMRVQFLQADKARLVPLKIKKRKCSAANRLCLKISFDNFLLQNVVPNIHLEYDLSSQKLMRFKGVGPVTRLNGKGLSVDINYEY